MSISVMLITFSLMWIANSLHGVGVRVGHLLETIEEIKEVK